jgi:response regulator RpfG family c-di-GMP phosphodiesterase
MTTDAATILIVDDGPAIRRFIRNTLVVHGHRVVEADSAASGLAAVSEFCTKFAGSNTVSWARDEVETAWQIVDSIRKAWDNKPLSNREFYAAGTWGPVAADDLLAQTGHTWREPVVVKC